MPANKDEGCGRVDFVRQRQQQSDGECGSDTGQNADGGADENADEAPHQIDRRQRDGEALRELGEGIAHSKLSIKPEPIL